jgi:ketosteroid isomerase-like protein
VAHPREEVERTLQRYLEIRSRAERGECGWDALADLFTEDATFIDPAWGRVDGSAALRSFFPESMAGLDGWTFPHEWHLIEGDRIVSRWLNRLPGRRADGSYYECPGISIFDYAGGGKFSREEDILNMAHFREILVESGWRPTGPMNLPPKQPRR